MTPVFDFSTFDIRDHKYSFAEMTAAEIAEKKRLLDEFQAAKAAKPVEELKPTTPPQSRPVFKPRMKPPGKPS